MNDLALFGLSAAQIATQTATPKPQVIAALNVAKSALATAATARYDFLTLDQAAVVARYEDDERTVTALIAAAQLGTVQFERVAAKADADATEAAADKARLDVATAALIEAGVTVIDEPDSTDDATPISWLRSDDGNPFTADTHATCPGHVAWLDPDWIEAPDDSDDQGPDGDGYLPTYVATYACTEPGRHPCRDAITDRDDAGSPAREDDASSHADDDAEKTRAAQLARDEQAEQVKANAAASSPITRPGAKPNRFAARGWQPCSPARPHPRAAPRSSPRRCNTAPAPPPDGWN